MNMKKLKFIALLFLGIGSLAMAQQGKGGKNKNPETRAAQMTEKMVEKLSLSEEQKVKVSQLNLSRILQMKELRQTYSTDKEIIKAKSKVIFEDYRKQMKATLTSDQLTKLKEWRKEKKANRPEKLEKTNEKDLDFLDGIE